MELSKLVSEWLRVESKNATPSSPTIHTNYITNNPATNPTTTPWPPHPTAFCAIAAALGVGLVVAPVVAAVAVVDVVLDEDALLLPPAAAFSEHETKPLLVEAPVWVMAPT